MHFVSSYSLVAMLTIAISNADIPRDGQNIDSARVESDPNKSKENYSMEQALEINSKQDNIEQNNGAPNHTENIKNYDTKLTKTSPKGSTLSQLDMPTDRPEATDIKSEVTTDQAETGNNFDEETLTINDNEVTGNGNFISDLLSDYYDEIGDTEFDIGINQTQTSTTNLPEANDNEKSESLSKEIAQTESVEREREMIRQESLESTLRTNQLITPEDVKSELGNNLYQAHEVEGNPEAIGSSKLINNNKILQDKHKQLDNKVINDLNTIQPQGIDSIGSNLSSAAGGVETELKTNHTTSSLKPNKHRPKLCSRLYKLIRSIFFPWRHLFSKLKCALLFTNQD